MGSKWYGVKMITYIADTKILYVLKRAATSHQYKTRVEV